MTNWIGPEWLPTIPQSDVGTFLCYILWVEDTQQYYVGQTVDPKRSIQEHFADGVMTPAGQRLELIWISDSFPVRRGVRQFEATLRGFVEKQDAGNFLRCTRLNLAEGATLLEPDF